MDKCQKCDTELTVDETERKRGRVWNLVCPNCGMPALVDRDHPSLNVRPGLVGPEQGKPTPGLRG